MEEISAKLLNKLGQISLDELGETLPTTITTDAHILKAEASLEKDVWKTLHHLSLTHSTLLYHRLSQKLYRPQNEKETGSLNNSRLQNEFPKIAANLRPVSPDETKHLLQLLPSDWTIVQITSENRLSGDTKMWRKIDDPYHTPSIYISRCRCGPSPSVLIKKISSPKEEGSVRSILQEVELIKGENKVISKHYMNDQEKYVLKREEVNNRLKTLVQSMSIAWLRHYACLLLGSLHPSQEEQAEKVVREAVGKVKLSLSDEEISLLTLMALYAPESIAFSFPLRAGVAALLKESVRSAKVKSLSAAVGEAREQLKEFHSMTRNPVILILDKAIVSLPWEMTHALQGQSVTRMPSLQSLVYLYLHHSRKSSSILTKGIDSSKGFYILDPDGNLPRSQERLEDTFSQTQWEGVRGMKPSPEEFKHALSTKDIFVYVGHGSGSQYMPAQLVETVECRSLVLLYGCSSASLARRGSVPDPWGVILNYFIASCPCVVGMLWEVMDKDTDLLTKEMVRALRGIRGPPGSPLEDPPTDVALLVAKARPLCSWYLISAALVVYGLPLQVVPQ